MQFIRGLLLIDEKEEKPEDTSDGFIAYEVKTKKVFIKTDGKWQEDKKGAIAQIFGLVKS